MKNIKLQDEKELLSKPGDTILETLEFLKMTQAELAVRLGKTPSKVNDLISAKEPITVATALQLEKVFGVEAQFWLSREAQYREKLTRIIQEELLEECKGWLSNQPIRELKKHGYLKSEREDTKMVDECLRFYGVINPDQWESLYIDQYISASFRKSSVHKAKLGSIAAWFRIGEIEMRKFKMPAYNKEEFKTALVEVKKLVRDHPEDFAVRLQQLCLDAGVCLVYTMCIPKAPISGAVRWIGGNPLIQLTDRYKSNDHFWFTFFHEAGHVILHGKKDVFLEDFEGANMDYEKEREADTFANKTLMTEDIKKEFSGEITETEIRRVARKYGTHPAIILGRLQHLQMLSYSFGNNIKIKIVLDDIINNN